MTSQFIRITLLAFLIAPAFAADEFEIARSTSASRHAELATRYQESGKLVDALREWRIVDAVVPGSDHVIDQIETISEQIRQRSRNLLVDAQSAFDNQNNELATRLLLAVLAYDPGNAVARKTLGIIESARSMAALESSPQKETVRELPLARKKPAAAIKPVESLPIIEKKPSPKASKPEQRISKQPTPKADKDVAAPKKPQPEIATKKKAPKKSNRNHAAANDPDHYNRLAERHFQNGLKLFLDDRKAAIIEFEMALRLNPNHDLARQYRATALGLIEK